MAWDAVRSSEAVLLLLIPCYSNCGVLCLSLFVVHCNHLDGADRVGCSTLIVFLLSCYSYCSVALYHGVVSWSAVCDCGIS